MDHEESILIRRSEERGYEDFGWTDNFMTFSFANFYDPDWIHFGPLRVIVENHIRPHSGFEPHPHQDMEIVTYVSDGVLTHKDSMGHESRIRAGEMQHITAGKGIIHSEMNEEDVTEHNIQIWILPDQSGYEPEYGQLRYEKKDISGNLHLYVSPDGQNNTLMIHQDVWIFAGCLPVQSVYRHIPDPGRGIWIQVVNGEVSVNGSYALHQGDGAGLADIGEITLKTNDKTAELILFDMKMDFKSPYNLS